MMSKFNRGSVFLSYADKDIIQAQIIYDGLTKRGLNVWFDIADFKHRSWKDWTIEAINQSRCLIVCLSRASLRELSNDIPGSPDKNIRAAYKIAQRERREDLVLFPVMIEDCDFGNFYLDSLIGYKMFHDFDKVLNTLSVDLGAHSLSYYVSIKKRAEEKKLHILAGKAETSFYAGDYTTSITAWDRFLGIKPDSYKAWNSKGTALCKSGSNKDAIGAYDNAIKIKPDYYEAWNNKGNALFKSNLHDAAMESYHYALKIKPEASKAWFNIGLALSRTGKYHESIEAYDKAIEIKPDYHNAWNNKGNTLYRLERGDEAVEAYNQAI
jgi:tetratricopeptide (TPR) repeat protein